jgi:hypothetical protein
MNRTPFDSAQKKRTASDRRRSERLLPSDTVAGNKSWSEGRRVGPVIVNRATLRSFGEDPVAPLMSQTLTLGASFQIHGRAHDLATFWLGGSRRVSGSRLGYGRRLVLCSLHCKVVVLASAPHVRTRAPVFA